MSLSRTFLNDFRPLFRLLEEPFHTPAFARFNRHPFVLQHQTPVEFSEEGNDVIVRAEVPGVQKEHLDVRLGNDGRSLTMEGRVIRASKAQVEAPAPAVSEAATPGKFILGPIEMICHLFIWVFHKAAKTTSEVVSQPEFRSSFSQTFWLPQPVDGAKATAELADGILVLRIPKREESRGRHIPIA
ncbi:hypothetical protein FS749_016171 [Ceratobasidium sp. UAMH 11750]|nr:hypothetical protein FS749_016171 [Ceratobasidium sp. UAMH 11750]